MLETPHVALGVAIATKIPNPLISIPLAFASHFLLERVPHWNPHLNTETKKYGRPTNRTVFVIAIDLVFSLITVFFISNSLNLSSQQNLNIIFCGIAAILPDLLEAPYFFLKNRNAFFVSWVKWQKALQVDTSFWPGLLTQVVTYIATLYWIFN